MEQASAYVYFAQPGVDYLQLAREKERQIHSQFSADHLRGEWFRLTPQLVSFIRAACGVAQREGESADA